MIFLKQILLFFFIGLTIESTAQPFRYRDLLFDASDTIKNVEYAKAEWLNNPIGILSDYNIHEGESITETRALEMDIFMPRNDTLTKRPAIIFSHSGAFLLGSRQNDDMIAFCDSFARRGYVTATIDYRMGMGADVTRFLGAIVGLDVNEKNAQRAGYRAVQDGRAAIRFLKHNSEKYGIDSSKIVMVGSSAGAIQALSVIYLDQENEIPESTLSEPELGRLDAVGVASSSPKPTAVVSMWGAIWNTEQIENNTTPVLLIHGEDDNIVPFKNGIPLEGTTPDNPFVHFNMPETYGSYCIDTSLANKGIPHETYFVKGKKHEFYGVNTGMFPPEGPNQYWDTIHQKISNFLLEQIKPEVQFELEIDENTLTTINKSPENSYVLWNFGDGQTSEDWQPEHTYASKGEYTVTLKVCNDILACSISSQIIEISQITNSSYVSTNNISVFPNPVSDILYVRGASNIFDVYLFDLTGQIQYRSVNYTQNQLNISSLAPGIYILKINSGNTSFIQKISKID